MRRVLMMALALLLMSTISVVGSTAAQASSHRDPSLSDLLTEMWTKILLSPAAGNPFNGGDSCIALDEGRVVVPFGLPSPQKCTVQVGTKIMIIAYSAECSDAEIGTAYGAEGERDLRKCASNAMKNLKHPQISFDGRSARISKVRTDLIQGALPADNLFGPDPDTITSAGQGWVTLIPAPCLGLHRIDEKVDGTDVDGHTVPGVTTYITVVRST